MFWWLYDIKINFSKMTYDVICGRWRHLNDLNRPEMHSEENKNQFETEISWFYYWKRIFDIHDLMTSLWRHRSWPESEKSSAPDKFAIDYDAKRIRSISLTSFEKKIQYCPPLKKISTLISCFKLQDSVKISIVSIYWSLLFVVEFMRFVFLHKWL